MSDNKETKQAPAAEAGARNPLLSILKDAAKWLHAAYDRPPQTPEAKAMLDIVDLSIQFADEASCGDAEQSVEAGARDATYAERAWEDHLDEQKRIPGMPGLNSRPCFLAGYRAALARASEAVAGEPVEYQQREREVSQLIDERDSFEHMSTTLANKVAELLGADVGEWSNANNPIFRAIHLIEDRLAAPQPASEPESSCDPADICAGCRCKYNTYAQPASEQQATRELSDDARECLMDIVSHHDSIVSSFAAQRREAQAVRDTNSAAYWDHEIAVARRMKAQAERVLAAKGDGQ